MEVIAALHTQLQTANTELEALQRVVEEQGRELEQRRRNSALRSSNLEKADSTSCLHRDLLKELLPRLESAEASILMANLDIESLQHQEEQLLPRLVHRLETARAKQHTLERSIQGLMDAAEGSKCWLMQTVELQRCIESARTRRLLLQSATTSNTLVPAKRKVQVDETKDNSSRFEEIMQSIEEEETAIAASKTLYMT